MDGSRGYHTKQSKSERERQIPYDITHMWNLKYDTNEHIYETETDSQTDRTIIQKDTYTRMFIAALFTIAKTCKKPKCPWQMNG